MPRNDQITQQWHLLRRLEGSNGLSLRRLVESVPDDYPRNARSVRRDLEGLEAVGFPIITERRAGQTRWRLIEGFRNIPALGFSATDLMALTFSRKLLQPLDGTEIQSALTSALNKVASALPLQGHEYVRALDNLFSIGLGPYKNYQQYKTTVDLITQAIDKTHAAQMRYFSASRGTSTGRSGSLSPLVRRRRALYDRALPS